MSWIPINMCQFFAMEFIAKKSSWIHLMDWVLDYFSNGSCVADFWMSCIDLFFVNIRFLFRSSICSWSRTYFVSILLIRSLFDLTFAFGDSWWSLLFLRKRSTGTHLYGKKKLNDDRRSVAHPCLTTCYWFMEHKYCTFLEFYCLSSFSLGFTEYLGISLPLTDFKKVSFIFFTSLSFKFSRVLPYVFYGWFRFNSITGRILPVWTVFYVFFYSKTIFTACKPCLLISFRLVNKYLLKNNSGFDQTSLDLGFDFFLLPSFTDFFLV